MVNDPSNHQGKHKAPGSSQFHSQSVHPRKFLQAPGKCDYHLLPASSSLTLMRQDLVSSTSCESRTYFPSSLYFCATQSNLRTKRQGAGASLTGLLIHSIFSGPLSLSLFRHAAQKLHASKWGVNFKADLMRESLGKGLQNFTTLREGWQCYPPELSFF